MLDQCAGSPVVHSRANSIHAYASRLAHGLADQVADARGSLPGTFILTGVPCTCSVRSRWLAPVKPACRFCTCC